MLKNETRPTDHQCLLEWDSFFTLVKLLIVKKNDKGMFKFLNWFGFKDNCGTVQGSNF